MSLLLLLKNWLLGDAPVVSQALRPRTLTYVGARSTFAEPTGRTLTPTGVRTIHEEV